MSMSRRPKRDTVETPRISFSPLTVLIGVLIAFRYRRRASASPRIPSRWDVLYRDYEMLRQDDRNFIIVMVTLGSVLALVAGTSAFFVLRSCAVQQTAGCHNYPLQVFALLPGPTLAGCALLVQQATAATIRGRLMLALERALVAETHQNYRLGDQEVPALTSYHFQQPVIHGSRGIVLWSLMFTLPLIAIAGVIYYCGTQFHHGWAVPYYVFYGGVFALLIWGGSPTFRTFPRMDRWLANNLKKQRQRNGF